MKEMPPYRKEPSTNHSSISPINTPTASRDKYVSPFPLRCPSPLQARLASSPLHIPLSIALKRLSSGGNTNIQGGSSAIQNLKNILQQFAESLYLTLQRQLYGKFNVEMKRIILRYRDVQKLIGRLQQKINTHADVLHAEEIFRRQQQRQQETIRGLEQAIKDMGGQLGRADKQVTGLLAERSKLESENQRLSAVAEKLETILLRKLQNHEQRNKQNERGNIIGERRQNLESKLSLPIRPRPYPDSSDSLSMELSSPSSTFLTNINQLPPSQSPIRTQIRLRRPPRTSHQASAVHLPHTPYY